MFQAAKSGDDPGRVIIYSESGPLAGDLGACLSGRFCVERVTSLVAAGKALERPVAALLVVPSRRGRMGSECLPLIRHAVDRSCRVILLGDIPPQMDEGLRKKMVVLPEIPSPAVLFEGLADLPGPGPGGSARPTHRAHRAEEG